MNHPASEEYGGIPVNSNLEKAVASGKGGGNCGIGTNETDGLEGPHDKWKELVDANARSSIKFCAFVKVVMCRLRHHSSIRIGTWCLLKFKVDMDV